ncbi:YihY/virulence factor BrkB family protein [Streptosporangium sandarakinum]|uniref:YihY/virulence factor BrkB family protein n=1 Tax=Streptosporangium sandarakinum TaxID=1260955 RepID=UPI0033A937D0
MSGEELSADHAWVTLRRYGRWHLVRDSFARFRYGEGMTNSRALAFQICLSIIPGAIALVGLSSVVNQEHLGEVLELTLSRITPGAGADAVRDVFAKSHRQAGHTGGTVALWLGLCTALISLTGAMAQVERGANRIYGVERDRPFHRKYGRALVMALTAGAFMTAGFVAMVGGGAIGRALAQVYDWGGAELRAFTLVRWPFGFLLAVLSASVLFRAAPRRRQPGHTWLAFGALVSIALWTVFTLLLALYIEGSGTFGSTYGPLTAVMALMLWSFLSSMALFLGLAFAAQLEACRAGNARPTEPDPGPTAEEEREPLVGAAGTAVADTVRRVTGLLRETPESGTPEKPERRASRGRVPERGTPEDPERHASRG